MTRQKYKLNLRNSLLLEEYIPSWNNYCLFLYKGRLYSMVLLREISKFPIAYKEKVIETRIFHAKNQV